MQAVSAAESFVATRTAGLGTELVVCVDRDDFSMAGWAGRQLELMGEFGVRVRVGERLGLVGTVNEVVGEREKSEVRSQNAGYMLGADDLRWRTKGWDGRFLEELAMGAGWVWGDDLEHGERLPTHAVMARWAVEALGWMCLPGLRHYCVDTVWRMLGERVKPQMTQMGADGGILRYVPGVVTEHLHWTIGKRRRDGLDEAVTGSSKGDGRVLNVWAGDAGPEGMRGCVTRLRLAATARQGKLEERS